MLLETRIAQGYRENFESVGELSIYSCPECSGVLRKIRDGDLLRFRCQVGHAFSIHTMLREQAEMLEESLWTTLRVLEERSRLINHIIEGVGHTIEQKSALGEEAEKAEKAAEFIRKILI
jgi:two-component system chemotaxis response regulator CheB